MQLPPKYIANWVKLPQLTFGLVFMYLISFFVDFASPIKAKISSNLTNYKEITSLS